MVHKLDAELFDPTQAERRLAGQIYRFIQSNLGGQEAGEAAVAEALASVRRWAIEVVMEQIELVVSDRSSDLIHKISEALEEKV